MTTTKKKVFGFVSGLALAASVFVGSFLTSTSALALSPCPAIPSYGYFNPGMAGMKCVDGDCAVRYACQIGPGTQIAHLTCAEWGTTCLMGAQCTVECP
ncbi:hypothetical protein [Chondromyces crocatus]|uniref:Uncharacterized protein n=1 Tax=Chondromyces crocatus TaxID=52 RepID=A0A0K1EME2_CHOCO|nr:hypothetical protein [Chondromyces crocatus]AKT42039.1 uncharacterized protein CMC5_062620 [Chondromyces crocatus]